MVVVEEVEVEIEVVVVTVVLLPPTRIFCRPWCVLTHPYRGCSDHSGRDSGRGVLIIQVGEVVVMITWWPVRPMKNTR
jgi:hypothetical protein